MFLLRLGWKNLTRHRRRTLITASVIALAVLFYVLLDSLVIGMTEMTLSNVINFETGHVQVGHGDYWEDRDELSLERAFSLEPHLLDVAQKVPGFVAMAGELDFAASLSNGVDELPVIGRGIDPADELAVFPLDEYIVSGRMVGADGYELVIGQKLAELMDLNIGDYVTLILRTREGTFNTIDGELVGLLNTPNPTVNESIVYVPLPLAQQALNLRGMVTQISIRLENRREAEKAADLLSAAFDEQGLPLGAYPWRQSADYIIKLMAQQNVENQIVLGIILLIAAVGITNTVILSALERMKEIGMMKALGLTEREIVLVFSAEALGIGVLGGLVGCLVGGLGVGLLASYGVDLLALGGADFDFGIPLIGRIYGGWSLGSFVFVFVYAALVSMVASVLPAVWAARKDPVKAMYHR